MNGPQALLAGGLGKNGHTTLACGAREGLSLLARDHSTHGQERNNVTDYVAMAELLKATDSDGFNGDTMSHIPKGFYDAGARTRLARSIRAYFQL